MGVFNLEQEPLPEKTNESDGKLDISNLRSLKIGAGSDIIVLDKEGQRFGSHLFDDAKAYIKTDGSYKFKNADGDVLIDSNNVGGDFINVINTALNTSSKKILLGFTFEDTDYAGAFKSGNVTWNTETGLPTGGTGVLTNARGIMLVKDGAATITLDGSTGDGTFKGTIAAGSVISANISADLITTGTLSADRIASGSISDAKLGTTVISGGKIITGLLTADNIQTGTLTGRTVQATSSTSGANIKLDATNKRISFLYDNSEKGYIYANSDGYLKIDADSFISIDADGSGDDILISAGDTLGLTATNIIAETSSDTTFICDEFISSYNDDNDGSDCWWFSNGGVAMELSSSSNLTVEGEITADAYNDFAEYFEATKEYAKDKIPLGTSVIIEGDKIRPAVIGEIPFGVISSTAGFILGAANLEWAGKYVRDEFGKKVEEEAEWWSLKKQVKASQRNKMRITGTPLNGWSEKTAPPKNAEKKIAKRFKVNPDYDPNEKYIPRKDRSEWNVVGLIGRVRVLKGQPVAPGWIKLRDISENVEEWLIK